MKDIKILKQYPYSIPQDYDFEYWYDYYHYGIKNKKVYTFLLIIMVPGFSGMKAALNQRLFTLVETKFMYS